MKVGVFCNILESLVRSLFHLRQIWFQIEIAQSKKKHTFHTLDYIHSEV